MSKLRVALLMGGTSSERPVSLKSGGATLDNLDPARYEVTVYDPRDDLPRLMADAPNLDVAVIMLHGRGGEDGSLQGLCDLIGLPYQSAGVLGCAMAMHKAVAKDRYRQAGIPVAPDMVLDRGQAPQAAQLVRDTLGLPVVVKPAQEGSSFGISIVTDPADLAPALAKAFDLDPHVLVERYLKGRELTCAVLGNSDLTPLPLIEIIPGHQYAYFDYEAKYTPGASREICPAQVSPAITAHIQDLAVRAHQALLLKGYSRSDFILTDRGPFILETNTIPGMTQTSLLPQAAAAAGMSFAALLDRLIELALEK